MTDKSLTPTEDKVEEVRPPDLVAMVYHAIALNRIPRNFEGTKFDFCDSVIYESELNSILKLVVKELADQGYCRSYFMDRVRDYADAETLFHH